MQTTFSRIFLIIVLQMIILAPSVWSQLKTSTILTPPPQATAPSLGILTEFGIIAGGNISSESSVRVWGDIGAAGTVDSTVKAVGDKTIYQGDIAPVPAATARLDSVIQFLALQDGAPLNGDLTNQVLTPGVYAINSSAVLNGTLTLLGDSASVYLIKVSDSLNVNAGSIIERGNIPFQKIFFLINGSIRLDSNISVAGILITKSSIILQTKNQNTVSIYSKSQVAFSGTYHSQWAQAVAITAAGIDGGFRCKFTYIGCENITAGRACDLVWNGTFEGQVRTVNALDEICKACAWYKPGIATPDYFSSNSDVGNDFCEGIRSNLGVPYNHNGFEHSTLSGYEDGQAYAGLIAYVPSNPGYKEYISTELKACLHRGKRYRFTMYVSLADNSTFSSDGLNVVLSVTPLTPSNRNYFLDDDNFAGSLGHLLDPLVDNGPLLSSTQLIQQTDGWLKVTVEFTAIGSERYLTIGNFNTEQTGQLSTVSPHDPTDPNPCSQTPGKAYYYIDDVSLYLLDNLADAGPDRSICVPVGQSSLGDRNKEVSLGSDLISCFDENEYQFSWTPTTGLDDPSSPTPVFKPTTKMLPKSEYTFTLTVTSPDGCTWTDEVQVNVSPCPQKGKVARWKIPTEGTLQGMDKEKPAGNKVWFSEYGDATIGMLEYKDCSGKINAAGTATAKLKEWNLEDCGFYHPFKVAYSKTQGLSTIQSPAKQALWFTEPIAGRFAVMQLSKPKNPTVYAWDASATSGLFNPHDIQLVDRYNIWLSNTAPSNKIWRFQPEGAAKTILDEWTLPSKLIVHVFFATPNESNKHNTQSSLVWLGGIDSSFSPPKNFIAKIQPLPSDSCAAMTIWYLGTEPMTMKAILYNGKNRTWLVSSTGHVVALKFTSGNPDSVCIEKNNGTLNGLFRPNTTSKDMTGRRTWIAGSKVLFDTIGQSEFGNLSGYLSYPEAAISKSTVTICRTRYLDIPVSTCFPVYESLQNLIGSCYNQKGNWGIEDCNNNIRWDRLPAKFTGNILDIDIRGGSKVPEKWIFSYDLVWHEPISQYIGRMSTEPLTNWDASGRGESTTLEGFDAQDESVPETLSDDFTLRQNIPNPFNPSTTIFFDLPVESSVTLDIYDILGRNILTLIESEDYEAGEQQIEFDATDLPSGLYFYRISAQGMDGKSFTDVKKMMLVK